MVVLLTCFSSLNLAGAAEPTDPTQQYVGIGIDGFGYWDGTHGLADLQGHTEYVNLSWGVPVVDTNGWPMQDVRALVSGDQLAAGSLRAIGLGAGQRALVRQDDALAELAQAQERLQSPADAPLAGDRVDEGLLHQEDRRLLVAGHDVLGEPRIQRPARAEVLVQRAVSRPLSRQDEPHVVVRAPGLEGPCGPAR